MTVPNNMCPQPPPPDRQYCNVLDCPVRWEVSEWSKCSKSCGSGIKDRRVECKQIMAQEHKVERPVAMCPSVKPPDKKPCNTKPCAPEEQRPPIALSNTTYIQHDPKKNKVTLKIGGAATVFFGTQIKIKCPVKRYNRTKIRWSKDQEFLGKTKKFKVSKKGALRILEVSFRDSGVYTCHAGLSKADLKLTVKGKPGELTASEDYERHRDGSGEFFLFIFLVRLLEFSVKIPKLTLFNALQTQTTTNLFLDLNTKSNQTKPALFLVPTDDRSHEQQQPKGTVRTKQQRQRNKGKNRHKSENVDDDGNIMENEVCIYLVEI